jgi:hypothetical protein
MVAMMEMTGETETPVTESMGASGGSARDVDNDAASVPGSKRPEFFERLREGRGRTGVPESGSAPAQSVRQKKSKKRELSPQSEIARIGFEQTGSRKEQRTFPKISAWSGKPTGETETTEVELLLYRFRAEAVGPQGRYVAGRSPEFVGTTSHFYRPRPYEQVTYVIEDAAAEAALNLLLSQLWSEGWQPTGWGQFWYDFRLRRVVLRSERSSSRASSPPGERSDS